MIKELIKDIAYDNILLGQGLTRAKLIANKVKNNVFKNWLNKELEGYAFDDEMLPSYRKLRCVIYFKVELPYGRWQTFPYILSDEAMKNKSFADTIHFHRAVEPISIIEKNLESLTTQTGEISLAPELTEMLGEQYKDQIESEGGAIRRAYKEIARVQYEAIIELTKQKLIDTLLELDNEFPDLVNEFNMTKDNIDKVQNIITTNIYGNNNPLNIASGNSVEQREITNVFTLVDYEKLINLGVEKKEIDDLKQIVDSNSNDKPSLKSKALKWIGSVTASLAAKGLYDNIPLVIEQLEKLL